MAAPADMAAGLWPWLVLAGGQRSVRDALRRPALTAPDIQLPYKLGTLLSPKRQQSPPIIGPEMDRAESGRG